MNREETIKLLGIITSAYPNIADKIKDPDLMASTWEMELGNYSAEAVYKAARLHIASSKYFPTPSNIIDNIVRAQLLYSEPTLNAIESHSTNADIIEQYLDTFCEWIGLGSEENDDVIFPSYLPYER